MNLVTSNYFGEIKCDFYENEEGKYFFTREQIGRALDYKSGAESIRMIHDRHKERLDNFSVQYKTFGTDGKKYNTILYSELGVYEICRWSKKEKANLFMDWVWNLVYNYRKETQIASNNDMVNQNILIAIQSLSSENKLLQSELQNISHKMEHMESLVRALMPAPRYTDWKNKVSKEIKQLSKKRDNGSLFSDWCC